jgi:hypothetical protein
MESTTPGSNVRNEADIGAKRNRRTEAQPLSRWRGSGQQ